MQLCIPRKGTHAHAHAIPNKTAIGEICIVRPKKKKILYDKHSISNAKIYFPVSVAQPAIKHLHFYTDVITRRRDVRVQTFIEELS